MSVVDPRPEIPNAVFRRVMGRFASGVTVITASANGETRGMTANAFMSGSLNPPLCVVSVAQRAQMHAHLTAAGAFGVNILATSQQALASHFAGRPIPGLAVAFADIDGIPTLADASAWIVADVMAAHPCGDHTLFIGGIRQMTADDRPPLLYHGGHYGKLLPIDQTASLPEFW